MIGKTISHYKITGKLGAGGMGVVFQAEDTKIRRTVALKFLPESLTRDADAKARFIREAQTAGRLDHPNVCTIHEIGESDDGQLYIVMGCYDGGSLEDLIKDGPLSVDRALHLAGQVAEGLDAAHSAGMVHRDIKPANILMSQGGQVKIVDFGLAKLTDQTKVTKTGTTLGTGSYMAPEQASGQEAGAGSDIWSLAVLTYEMLTGEKPFKGDFLPAVVYSIVHEDPRPASEVNPALDKKMDAVFEKGLAKDPAHRFSSAGEMVAAFQGEIIPHSGETRSPRVPKSTSQAHSGTQFSWRRLGLAALILVVVVAGYLGLTRLGVENTPGPLAEGPRWARTLAILPFSYQGDAGQRHLAEQIPQLLADRLHRIGDLYVIVGDTLAPYLTREEKQGVLDGSIAATADRLASDLVLSGKITVTGPNLQVSMNVIDSHGRRDSFSGEIVLVEQALTYADRLALRSVPALYPDPWSQVGRLAAESTDNWVAVSHLIAAEMSRRFLNFPRWKKEISAALQADSTLALAHYNQACLYHWDTDLRRMLESARRARRHAANLGQTGRDLIEALNLSVDHEMDAAENLLNRVVLTEPECMEAWYYLGIISYETNYLRGRSIAEAYIPFSRMEQLDPNNRVPGLFYQFLWSMLGDSVSLRNQFTPANGKPMSLLNRWLMSFVEEDLATQSALADSVNLSSLNTAQAVVLSWPDNHENGLRFLKYVQDRVESELASGWAAETMAHLCAGMGRWQEALTHYADMPEFLEPWRLTYQSIMTAMPFMECNPDEIETMISEVQRWRPRLNFSATRDEYGLVDSRYAPDFALHSHMKEFSLGLLYLRLGDLEGAQLALVRLEDLPVPLGNGPMIRELILSVRAWIAYEKGQFEESMAILDGAAQYPFTNMGYSGLHDRPFQRYLRALTLEKLGRLDLAASWFEFIGEKTERTAGFVAPAHLRLGRIFEQMGDPEAALRHYWAFLGLYRECDPRFEPRIEEAKARVAALTSD